MPEQKLPYIVSQFDIEHETTETQVQPVIYRKRVAHLSADSPISQVGIIYLEWSEKCNF